MFILIKPGSKGPPDGIGAVRGLPPFVIGVGFDEVGKGVVNCLKSMDDGKVFGGGIVIEDRVLLGSGNRTVVKVGVADKDMGTSGAGGTDSWLF